MEALTIIATLGSKKDGRHLKCKTLADSGFSAYAIGNK
jgi:hypothetical protein